MKKTVFLLFIIIFSAVNLISQTITTDPEYPTAEETVTVYFDATGTALEGYSGDVYAHTGVNLSDGSQWQYVIGTWGDNSVQPQLTRISTDYYSLQISPSINDFYGISQTDTVVQLAFVFRSSEANQQTSDLFLDVYSVSNYVTIATDSSTIYKIGDSVQIEAVAMFADSMKLFFEDTLFYSTDSNLIKINVEALKHGKTFFTVIGKNQTTSDTAQSFFFVRKNTEIEQLPQNLNYGANYIDSNTVTLCLYAPFKDFIFVKGDFNNWKIKLDYQMKLNPDSNIFWITIDSLTPQEEYAYQFYVDSEFSVADPYTEKILDPDNDQYISNSTYPDLKPYPQKAEGIVSVFQTNKPEYDWQIENFERPEKENLIIYELLVRDFIEAHNYQTLIDTINYLKNLGINAIELMPVNEFEGNSSWGYNPSFYFAADKYYGTENKLKEIIDVCHQNGIAVIMDVVFNHSYGQSPLVQLYLNRNTWQVTEENPWYNVESPNPAYSWGYDFDHESQATVNFVDSAITFWLKEYKFDGFRFDFTKGFTNNPGEGWYYDQDRIDILKHYYDVSQEVSEGSYLILEHFAENSEEIILSDYGMLIWGNINHNYSQAAMGYSSESDFSWISYLERGWDNPFLVGYMESHDEERIMFKNIMYGNSSETYSVTDTLTALERIELAACFFITIPGPKMIWQFGELGYDVSIDEPCRVCEKPILWEYFDNYYRNRLYNVYKTLINLRKEHNVFKTDNFVIDAANPIKTITLYADTMDVFIVGNFDVEEQTITPDFPENGIWYEYFTHTEINSGETLTLSPGDYKLFTTKQLPKPQIPELAVAPEITEVTISGNPYIYSQLSADYTFYDFNGDNEGESSYQWYISDYADGRYKKEITGAADTVFTITENEYGKYIGFEVTPVAQSDELKTGNPKTSSFVGPVNFENEEITIFPNPFDMEISFINIENYDKIIISDTKGSIVDNFEIKAKNYISKNYINLRRGIYIVKIIGETEEKSFKIIKL